MGSQSFGSKTSNMDYGFMLYDNTVATFCDLQIDRIECITSKEKKNWNCRTKIISKKFLEIFKWTDLWVNQNPDFLRGFLLPLGRLSVVLAACVHPARNPSQHCYSSRGARGCSPIAIRITMIHCFYSNKLKLRTYIRWTLLFYSAARP